MKRSLGFWMLAPVVAAALVLTDCNGDDDDVDVTPDTDTPTAVTTPAETPDDETATPETATPETATATAGGETATVTGTSTAVASGQDEEDFARELCVAFRDFYAAAEEALTEDAPDAGTLGEVTDAVQNLRDDIAAIDAPGDYQQFKDEAVDTFDEIASALEEGDPTRLGEIELPDVGVDLQSRLQAAAEGVEECQELDEEFGSIFGAGSAGATASPTP